ncbi:DNA topoisomerase-1 [Catalinimonas alkaloidigena]|uniref:DNA topoisomerase IB n=1 Tax=Catalinimonas alkaloidigena TaxID=1075417 RepID=UPI002404FCC2|nr:DNA topoisomerase IB [Catalinimonas alkaloidigena]MDF9796036.1 DNA topoisomerase-1 [Catalinimonas alkaloidigena]
MKSVECPADLVYASQEEKGLTRIKRGKGFSYHDESGNIIKDDGTLDRIKSLGIPPMWKKVWVSTNAQSHIQATGLDQKNRKQYIYHAAWIEYRNLAKFSRIKEFGLAIPTIRKHTSELLKEKGWSKEKVICLVIQMMDEYHIRIGNQYYKDQHETFGATTLRNKHLDFEKGVGRLEYKAKSGKYRKISLHNNHITRLIKECADLPGYEIFTYKDGHRKYQAVNSHDVNEYLHQIAGESFSSKDFRTWGGTTLAVERQAKAREAVDKNPRLKYESTLVKLVAKELGNTVSVCKEYYIHPKVLKAVIQESLKPYSCRTSIELPSSQRKLLRDSEIIALNILQQ